MKNICGHFHELPVVSFLYQELELVKDRSQVLERAGHVVNVDNRGEEGASCHHLVVLRPGGQEGHQLYGGHGVADIVQARG